MLGIFPLLSCQKKKLKKPKENANHLYPHSVTYLSLETTGRGPIQVGSHQECILNFLTSSWKPRIRIFPDERFQFGKKKSWHLGWIWFLNIGFLSPPLLFSLFSSCQMSILFTLLCWSKFTYELQRRLNECVCDFCGALRSLLSHRAWFHLPGCCRCPFCPKEEPPYSILHLVTTALWKTMVFPSGFTFYWCYLSLCVLY